MPLTAAWIAAAILTGCDGPQSTLTPAGRGAEVVADLFWWMAAGALVVWLITVGLAIYAIRIRPGPHPQRPTAWLIIGGGVAFPTVVLAVLLAHGLAILPGLMAPAPPGSLQIEVTGEQWWWRFRYRMPDDTVIELANELRLPVGHPVEFHLESADVVHSFWIPSLGGKVDMIPGRRTRLTLEPTRTGRFRGACAEFCGASHAFMNFSVVILEPDDFEVWWRAQAAEANQPGSPELRRGRDLFLSNGCGACHAIRGTEADGVIGPDLTHVGGRLTLAAGATENSIEALMRWIGSPGEIKPNAHMPRFGMLPGDDLEAMATYLYSLK